MCLFRSKDEKDELNKKFNALIDRYKLNDIDSRDLDIINGIFNEFEASPPNLYIASYLNALVQQNWIIIRKLDEISNKLDQ